MSAISDLDAPIEQTKGEILFPPSWQGLRQQIVYLAQFGNSIQVIHADEGGGKSAFFNHLLATGIGSTTVGVTVIEGAGLVAFFGDVLQELGLRPDARATLGELVASLRGYVQTLHKERSRAVLLVDDAHHLTDSELGALVSTLQGQADAGVGLHVVLFAEPGLAARIDSLQVLDVAVHDAPLPVFSVAEVQQLLTAKRGSAGHIGTEQAQRVWYQSRGLPGAALGMVKPSSPPPPTAENVMSLRGLPTGHIAALLVLCGVLVWAFLVRQAEEPPADEAYSPPVAVEPPATTPTEPVSDASPTPEQPPAVQAPKAEAPALVVDVQPSPSSTTSPTVDADAENGANFDATVETPAADDIASNESTASQPVSVEPQLEQALVMPNSRAASANVADGSKSFADRGAAKLLALPANGYVLQLMAASAEDKLAEYVASQPNKANLSAYRTERGGKVLYILVEGFYADKASAQAAVSNLPQEQQKGGPWPKKIEQIHQELRKNP